MQHPEKSLITFIDYLVSRADLFRLMVLAQVAYIDRRILIYLERLMDLVLRYGEPTGDGRYQLNLRRVLKEGGEPEYEKAISLIKSYNMLRLALLMSPNIAHLVDAFVRRVLNP